MARTTDLLPGTLDMLILKAVSLRPLHGYGVLLRIAQISETRCRSRRDPCIRRCTGSSTRVSSRPSGARATTIEGRSSTRSRLPADDGSGRKRRAGIDSPPRSRKP